ncbi:hypothetical protein [Niallia sp. 03190]|uniref:hypothetical protein n=1 Tax=Niallia sp. 03190 TaxID=3458061 RepID=UPI0040448E63
MKKIAIGVLTASFILGAGSYAFALTYNNDQQKAQSFEKMKPLIQKMHPNLSPKEQKKMFNKCPEKEMMKNQGSDHMNIKDMMDKV